jgi:hypothetical protein
MKKLSKALEDLRKCIPAEYHISNRKMSKIRTLRLAVNYIASLTEIIERDNVLKQQTYHLENQMLQSTFSYIMPSPMAVQQFIHQGSLPRLPFGIIDGDGVPLNGEKFKCLFVNRCPHVVSGVWYGENSVV